MTLQLSGLVPPLVTPMTEDEEIDEEGVRREIRYLLNAGVHGVTLAGSSGEGEKLTIEEACRLARIALDEVHGTVPVVMGIIQDSTRAAIRYGKALKEAGNIYGLQITPVHYSRPPDEAGTLTYYAEIGQAVQLPIVIYNVIRWNMIDVPTLLKLGEQEWIVAVKQSAGDIVKLADLLQRVHTGGSSLRVLSAIDTLLFPSFLMGSHGTVAAAVTVLPYLTRALWDACEVGDIARAVDLHERILPVILLMHSFTTNRMSVMKTMIEVQGRQVGPARRPDLPLSPEIRDRFKQAIELSGELDMVPATASTS